MVIAASLNDMIVGRAWDGSVICDFDDVILSLSKDERSRRESNSSTTDDHLAVALSLAKGDRTNRGDSANRGHQSEARQ
jgi:hypothetical protein